MGVQSIPEENFPTAAGPPQSGHKKLRAEKQNRIETMINNARNYENFT
jgi:hypothetical protein